MMADSSLGDRLRDTPLAAYLRATGVLLALGVLLKLAGALLQALLAALFGVGPELDAYFAAVALPNLLISFLILGPLGLALVPGLARAAGPAALQQSQSALSALLTLTLGLSVTFTVAGYLAAPAIIAALAPGFGPGVAGLSVELFRLTLPAVGLAALNALLRGVFHAFQRFEVPTGAYVLSDLLQIVALVALSPAMGIHAAAAGMVLGGAAALVWQWWLLARAGLKLGLARPSWGPDLRRLAGPLAVIGLAMAAFQSMGLWARLYASELGPGSVAILNYGLGFDKVVGGLVAVSAATAVYPTLAAQAATATADAAQGVRRGLRGVLLLSLPLVLLIVTLRHPLVRLWLERGRFGPEDSIQVSALVMLLAPALLAGAVAYPLLYAFHALGQLRAPAFICLMGTVAGAALGYALRVPWGLQGVALAVSLSGAGTSLALLLVLTRRLSGLWGLREVRFTAKLALAGGAAAVVSGWDPQQAPAWLALGLGAAGGGAAYLLALLLLRVEEAQEAWRWLRQRLGRFLPTLR